LQLKNSDIFAKYFIRFGRHSLLRSNLVLQHGFSHPTQSHRQQGHTNRDKTNNYKSKASTHPSSDPFQKEFIPIETMAYCEIGTLGQVADYLHVVVLVLVVVILVGNFPAFGLVDIV